MHFDFIEIGTSNFNTLIEKATSERGLSIEPVKYYLDSLPSKPNVKKLQVAIVSTNKSNVQIYYIPEEVLKEKELPGWLAGCNSIDGYHFQHNLLNLNSLVRVDTVPALRISTLWEQEDIDTVDLLKVDTEGCDCGILLDLYQYLTSMNKPFPKRILFEANSLSNEYLVDQVLVSYKKAGFSSETLGENIELRL